MIKALKYLFTIFMPWLSMFMIEENMAGVVIIFLQLTVIGWIPGAIWACHLLKKHLKKVDDEKNNQPGAHANGKSQAS